ncbi:pyruvate kinase [Pasteurella multocida]|uniref:pyruvate kinase n=1 Tax=Pasteurella multocida TaxID=747 RepID=UPI001F53086F|nr:pyruvate kinase [Pasteurella multocida]
MKEFNLEKALAGEPVELRNGRKAFVKFVIDNPAYIYSEFAGYYVNADGKGEYIGWHKDGRYDKHVGSGFDIVGMYEEPRPTVTLTLPCPLETVEEGQEVFYLNLYEPLTPVSSFSFQIDSASHFNLYKSGGLFATKKDAQAWFDALKNARS